MESTYQDIPSLKATLRTKSPRLQETKTESYKGYSPELKAKAMRLTERAIRNAETELDFLL